MSMLHVTGNLRSALGAFSLAYQLFVFWIGVAGLAVTSVPAGVEGALGVVLPLTLAGRLVDLALVAPGPAYLGLVVWSVLPSLSRTLATIGQHTLLALLWEAVFGR